MPTIWSGIAKLGKGGSNCCRLLAVTVTIIWHRVSQVVHAGFAQLFVSTSHTVASTPGATLLGIQLLLDIAVAVA